MNTTRATFILLLVIIAGALAQLQNEYYFIMPDDCETPRRFDYAYEYHVESFKCHAKPCGTVTNLNGTKFTTTTVCESDVQITVNEKYMSVVPCKNIASGFDGQAPAAAYYRFTSCVPQKGVPWYQLTEYDADAKVFNVYKCPDRFCDNCIDVVKPNVYPANECTGGNFYRVYP